MCYLNLGALGPFFKFAIRNVPSLNTAIDYIKYKSRKRQDRPLTQLQVNS